MAKYHINAQGNPGVCRAQRACPFGGESEHFGSAEEARMAYEGAMSGQTFAEAATSAREATVVAESTGLVQAQRESLTVDAEDTLQELERKNAYAFMLVQNGDTKSASEAIDASLLIQAEINRRKGLSNGVTYNGGANLARPTPGYKPQASYEQYRPLTQGSTPAAASIFDKVRGKRAA